jgi:hypothetical protein
MRWRVALGVLVALILGGIAALVISHEAGVGTYRQTEADAVSEKAVTLLAFQFDHPTKLKVTKPADAYVKVEKTPNGLLASRFTVSPFRFQPEPGLVSGYLPIIATRLEKDATRRYKGFRLNFEGRARVNEVEGYQYAFRAQLPREGKPDRQPVQPGRDPSAALRLEQPGRPVSGGQDAGPRRPITILSTSLDTPNDPVRVGDEGALKQLFRSFRFG